MSYKTARLHRETLSQATQRNPVTRKQKNKKKKKPIMIKINLVSKGFISAFSSTTQYITKGSGGTQVMVGAAYWHTLPGVLGLHS
jgi:hypothetical protein